MQGTHLLRIPGARPVVALTFDDGDDPDAWKEILDLLDGAQARASSFPSGMRVEERRARATSRISAGSTPSHHDLC